MLRERLRATRRELTAESMRTATLVGLAAIPVGFLWIYLFGTTGIAVTVLAGILVGIRYSGRPTPAHRAGARAGLFAPIPEAIVLPGGFVLDVWTWSVGVEVKLFFTALLGLFLVLLLWVVGALSCIASAVITEAVVNALRDRRSDALDRSG